MVMVSVGVSRASRVCFCTDELHLSMGGLPASASDQIKSMTKKAVTSQ